MSQPAPKRRRLSSQAAPDPNLGETSVVKLIQRHECDIRTSLQQLHSELDRYGDVIICAQGEQSSEEFACVSALLASASRPLGAMLFGPMCAARPGDGDGRRRLTLNMTEPGHFKNLLLYIHGQDIPLQTDDAVQLHHVADFYEVLGLRDACCRFLLDSLSAHNCCHLLSRAYEVHCEPLIQRCLGTLTLDFIAVVEHDRDFPHLSTQVLKDLLSRDELVCAEEYEVFEAITTWYLRNPDTQKHADLHELLPLVRWPLVRGERRAEVLALAARLHPPREPADGVPPSRSPSAAGGLQSPFESAALGEPSGAESHAESDNEDMQADTECFLQPLISRARRTNLPKVGTSPTPFGDVETEASVLVRALFPEAAEASTSDGAPSIAPSTPSDGAGKPSCRERHYMWGRLVSRSPPPATAAGAPATAGGGTDEEYLLQSTKEYMVGRSRKSDIRIGHLAPMPYISSQHFRVYHAISWPDESVPLGDDEERMPSLQAWLEDLSQNGTFINNNLVGKGKSQALCEGDRIEMVFPHGRQPPQQSSNAFPIFTFLPHRSSTSMPPPPPPALVPVPVTLSSEEPADDEL